MSEKIESLKRELDSQRIAHNALINSLDQGLAVIGPEGRIRQVNTYALDALGFDEDEIIGHRFSQVIIAADDMGHVIDPIRRPITEAFIEGRPYTEYTNLRRKNGSTFPVALTASPIIIDGKPAGAIDVFRDLTKERQLDLAKNDFVSLASHQLRTPATGVKAILHMLWAGDFGEMTPVQQKYLQRALDTNERQLHIIEDLLNVARADAGALEINFDYVNISDIVRSTLEEHLQTAKIRGHKIEMSIIDNAQTSADAQKLGMVIDNLISNAIKYTPDSGLIKVGVFENQKEVTISIEDNGIGINIDNIPTIFEKFGRVENELSSAGDGTGLGLYLAREVIILHNGDIRVTSEPNKGTTFQVILPKIRKGATVAR